MMVRILILLLAISGCVNAVERPNIVLILADDLGWSDLACYGHPWHETPNLDKFAADGLRFTYAYSPAPICSASRASILTGKTTARTNFEFVTKNEPGFQKVEGETPLRAPPLTLNLDHDHETIAELLAKAGYETAFMGKWHLNQHHGGYLGWSPTHGPAKHGFATTVDDFGAHPYAWRRSPKRDATEVKPGEFPADALTDAAIRFVNEERDAPCFLMWSLYFVHTPIEPTCAWLEEKYEALVPADSPNRAKRVKYGAFVEMLDHYVGQLLNAIGDSDDTLIVFTSDNGAHPEFAANGPLRGSKWNLYEGGIRVPFIARWPGAIAAASESGEPVIGYDLLPTFAELAGAEPGADVDGLSIAGILRGDSELNERNLLWHFPYYHPERGFADSKRGIGIDDFEVSQTRPQSAMRRGSHKIVFHYEEEKAEVYDLANDIGEQNPLASDDGRVQQLLEQLQLELKSAGARLPEKNSKN